MHSFGPAYGQRPRGCGLAQPRKHSGRPMPAAQRARAHGAVTTPWSSAVVRLLRACRWQVLDEVFIESTGKAAEWRRARWRREGPTREGCRRRGGERVPRRWCLSTATELRWTPWADFGSHNCAKSRRVWGRGRLTRRKLRGDAHRGLAVGGDALVEFNVRAWTPVVEAGQEVRGGGRGEVLRGALRRAGHGEEKKGGVSGSF
jgi:hypothetical protein